MSRTPIHRKDRCFLLYMDSKKMLDLLDKLIVKDAYKLKDAYNVAAQLEDKPMSIFYMRKIRSVARQIPRQDMLDLVYKTYLYNAVNGQFDDYLIYLEHKREPSKRFYLPRRNVLLPIVKEIQRMLDDELDLLSISLPPGTGKSTLEIFLLSYVCGMYPNKCNLLSGHSGSLTNSIYEGVLGILRDEEYCWHDVFPTSGDIITNAKEQTLDIGAKHRFSTLTCCPINGSLTGRTRCEGFLCADDLCSGIEEAMNKERLDKLWMSYTNDLASRCKLGAKKIFIATRWSVHDPIGRLERKYRDDPRAKFISIPALNEKGESNFDYQFGVGFDTAYFEDMKSNLDDVSWKCLFMNEPIEREGLLFTAEEMRYYYELPTEEPDYIVSVVDTAEGGGDDTFMPIAYGYGDDWYIEDCVVSDGLPAVTDELCCNALLKNDVKMCQFESNSAGGRTADNVQKMVKERGGRTNITKKRTTANKETKIFVNSAWIKEHCLFKDKSVITKGSMYESMMDKLFSYSLKGRNKHDDIPDGMAQLSEFIQGMAGQKIQFFQRPF